MQQDFHQLFGFKTSPDQMWFPRMAIISDVGSKDPVVSPYLENGIYTKELDMVIHSGDISSC